MKRILISLATLAALSTPAMASTHHTRMNCGYPRPDPACFARPPVRPTPAPASTTPTTPVNPIQGVIEALIDAQAAFVADVNAADTVATQMWPPTPAGGTPPAGQGPIDPIAAACYPTLATWAAGLALPSLPTPGTGANGLVTTFEDARVANIAAQTVIQQINAVGFPTNLKIACGGLITDTVTQGGVIAGEVASFATLLAKFIPVAVLERHHVGYLATKHA